MEIFGKLRHHIQLPIPSVVSSKGRNCFSGACYGGLEIKSIFVTDDNWIPNRPAGTLVPAIQLPDNAKVDFFLSDDGSSWKENSVREAFDADTADRILSIPLSSDGCSDFASWPHCKSGSYTVRSAYNLIRIEKFWEERS